MKYTVHGRQSYSILQEADEIRVEWRDRERIMDFIERIPDKTILLEADVAQIIADDAWNYLTMIKEKMNLILVIKDLSTVPNVQRLGFKWFWAFPVSNWQEFRTVIALNPEYILLGGSLFFDLRNVKTKTSIPIRLCANGGYDFYLPAESRLCFPWLRPNDVSVYEPYVDALEFYGDDLPQEATLLKVYKSQKWPGNLNFIINHLNIDVDNRSISEEFAEVRIGCRQKCMENGSCHYCHHTIHFAETLRKEHERRTQEKEKN